MSNIILLSVIVLFSCVKGDVNSANSVDARLQFKTIKTQNYGALNSVEILIRNNSDKRIYLADILPLHLELLKKTDDGIYNDYFDNWMYGELHLTNMDSIYHHIGVKNGYNKVYDVVNRKFTDIVALNFYHKLMKNLKVKSTEDTLAIASWIRKKFESTLYLEPNDEYKCVESISSLEKGSYKIYFYYSNLDGGVKYLVDKYDYLNLQLPEVLNEYTKWNGSLKSDTIQFNIN
jgi:hypothetical protein